VLREPEIEAFQNRRVIEKYWQDDVTVLRQVCRVFKREFMYIGNIEVFIKSITISSACNKILCKRFLQPDTKDSNQQVDTLAIRTIGRMR